MSSLLRTFNSNFRWRLSGRVVNLVFSVAILQFILLLNASELAALFFLRSVVNLTSSVLKTTVGGNNFYKAAYEAKKQHSISTFYSKHLIRTIFLSALVSTVVFLALFSLNNLKLINLSAFELMIAMTWAFSRIIQSSFHNYFQLRNQHFLSGLSNGSLFSLIHYFILLYAFSINSISLMTVLMAPSIAYLFLFILFSLLAFNKKEMKNYDVDLFKKTESYQEGISTLLNKPFSYFLMIAYFFVEEELMNIMGFVVFIMEILNLIPTSYVKSKRTNILESKRNQLAVKKVRHELKKVISIILISMILLVLVVKYFMNILDISSYSSNIYIISESLVLVLIYLVSISILSLLFQTYAEGIVILYEGTRKLFQTRLESFIISNFLFLLVIVFFEYYALIFSCFFVILYQSIIYNNYINSYQNELNNN